MESIKSLQKMKNLYVLFGGSGGEEDLPNLFRKYEFLLILYCSFLCLQFGDPSLCLYICPISKEASCWFQLRRTWLQNGRLEVISFIQANNISNLVQINDIF